MEHVPQGVTMSQENLLEGIDRVCLEKERMLHADILVAFMWKNCVRTPEEIAQWMELRAGLPQARKSAP